VELTLFGPAWCLYAWVLAALRDVLEGGDGRRGGPWSLAEIKRVAASGERQLLAAGAWSDLPSSLEPDHLPLSDGTGFDPGGRAAEVAIDFLSPTLLVARGRALPRGAPVTFDLLVKSVLDRVAGLYGLRASPLLSAAERRQLEDRAALVPLVRDESTTVDAAHYSARSQYHLFVGGRLGRLVYGAEAQPFLPLLRTAEIVHLGKNPTFGCGRLQVAAGGPVS
jgi:hypothetical protein